jgi:hypothetical protein
MRGGAQSHLMRCADGHYYVVKFQNNSQHRRILVNERLGTKLASRLGLTWPWNTRGIAFPATAVCNSARAIPAIRAA